MAGRQQDGPAGIAVPGRPEHRSTRGAMRLDQRRDRLGPDPRHPRRPEQDRGRVAHLGQREFRAAHHLAGGTDLRWGRGAVDRLGTDERRRDRPIGVRGDDDDRECPTGPGEVRQSTHPRLAERVGERALGGRGQDDGGNGHAPECSRPAIGNSHVPASVGQSGVPFDLEQ